MLTEMFFREVNKLDHNLTPGDVERIAWEFNYANHMQKSVPSLKWDECVMMAKTAVKEIEDCDDCTPEECVEEELSCWYE